jgi:hypothetical protein
VLPSQEAKAKAHRRSHPKAASGGMRDEKTQDGALEGNTFVDGVRVVSYMTGSHRYVN